jgi:hypothetical protein
VIDEDGYNAALTCGGDREIFNEGISALDQRGKCFK